MTDFVSSRFRTALDALFALEGFDAVTDDPHDNGGLTRWGISQRAFPDVDIRHLTREAAADLYLDHFWYPLRCDRLLSAPLASELFELGVNCGVRVAARLLQESINASGKAVSADGSIGPATIAAANGLPEARLLLALRLTAAAHYGAVASSDPTQRRYLQGWLRRLKDL